MADDDLADLTEVRHQAPPIGVPTFSGDGPIIRIGGHDQIAPILHDLAKVEKKLRVGSGCPSVDCGASFHLDK